MRPTKSPPSRQTVRLSAEVLEARDLPATFFVSPTGADGAGRGTSPADPVRNIQFAVNQAASDDTIRVAAGSYTFDAGLLPSSAFGSKAVVFMINKRITLLGGFTPNDFTNSDPAANPTVIDGGGQVRGVLTVGLGPVGATNLIMDGFTVQNGLAVRNPMAPDSNTFLYGEGGGVALQFGGEQNSPLTNKLSNLILRNNVARGADTDGVTFEGGRTFNYGGFGVGGGLFASFVNNLQLDQITIDGNQAVGGDGRLMAGAALGGGVWLDNCRTTATNIQVANNKAVGGRTNGPNTQTDGRANESFGGGIVVRSDPSHLGQSSAAFTNITITGNQSVGSNTTSTAPGSIGGDAVGAGFTSEYSALSFADALVRDNTTTGGTGFDGGLVSGGGIRTFNDTLTLDRVAVLNNTVTAGGTNNIPANGRYGPAGGGGLYLTNFDTTTPRTVNIRNTVVADNKVLFPVLPGAGSPQVQAGGGGGGIWFQGTKATLENVTVAANRTDDRLIFGQGALLLSGGVPSFPDGGDKTDVTIRNSIFSDHRSNSDTLPEVTNATEAVTAQSSSTVRFQNVLFANNDADYDTNPNSFGGGGTFAELNVLTAADVGYASTGGVTPVPYGLSAGSAAVDKSTGSTQTTDLFNVTRTGTADLGAVEVGSSGMLGRRVPTPANALPTISDIGNVATGAGQPVGPIAIAVGDAETPAGLLTVTAISSNTAVVPTAGIALGGAGANRTLTLTPAAGVNGTTTITVTVLDTDGRATSDTFLLTAGNPAVPSLVGFRQFAVGTDRGGDGSVIFYNPDRTVRFSTQPFGTFAGGVRTASADFNGDGIADVVAGTGPGRATRVVVIDGASKAELFAVDAFEPSFTGGVYVTAGDVTGDGKAELFITPDEGGGPRVDVYNGAGFGKLTSFFGIDDPNFRGGARAATGDISGDGRTDLIVVAGFGGGPRVAAFNGTTVQSGTPTRLFGDFFAFEQSLRNGVFVTAGDLDGDGKAELIAGGGPGGGPRVTGFSGAALLTNTQTVLTNFFGGDANSRGGVRLSVKNLDGDNKADILVGAGSGAGSRVTGYLGATLGAAGGATTFDFDAVSNFGGGVFVG